MTDSKFCEHGVNVGLENPPVFCGQCPPDTITKLRADLADKDERYRVMSARHEARAKQDAEDLARVMGERDRYAMIARAANEVCESWKNGCEKAEKALDEARAKVAGLSLTIDVVKTCRRLFADAIAEAPHAGTRKVLKEDLAEMNRYAEALGGVR